MKFASLENYYVRSTVKVVTLTADFSLTGLFTALRMMVLFCRQVQHRSLIGLPTTMYGTSERQ